MFDGQEASNWEDGRKNATKPMRERLILAAIDEIEEVGFERFSVRRVAGACGASCAAPYKHFKNKREFFEEILRYINGVWLERQERILVRLADKPLRQKLVELAVDYIRFMVENPRFRSILMIKDATFDVDYLQIKSEISACSKELIRLYCEEVGMPPAVAKIKMYVVRSLIYGASLMFGNCELNYDERTLNYVRATIEREFDLPWTFGLDADVPEDERRSFSDVFYGRA